MPRGWAMIAHQGGWDEILLVLGPIAVIVGLLVVLAGMAMVIIHNRVPGMGEAPVD